VDELLLVVNAGSSSLKLSIIAADDAATIDTATIESSDGGGDAGAMAAFLRGHHVGTVAHRVVHGGTGHTGPVVLDDATEAAIAALAPLAPLHQGRSMAGIAAARRALPDAVAVACFDTAFHTTIPVAAATYAVPAAWRERWGLRRFGFHGLSHQWASRRAAELLGRPLGGLAMITCHLGAGASLCAVDAGVSTMGFTPLEGLVMATRSGSVDPGLLTWLLRQGVGLDELEDGLERRGGLVALCGTDDMRRLLLDRERGMGPASEAFDVYVHRLCREAGGMIAGLGRLDALVFTGGVGERASAVRAAVAAKLSYLGVALDLVANTTATSDAVLSAPGSAVATVVVTAREDLEIARQTAWLLTPP
jgi:acetate kinase